jgi:hypothetical protein
MLNTIIPSHFHQWRKHCEASRMSSGRGRENPPLYTRREPVIHLCSASELLAEKVPESVRSVSYYSVAIKPRNTRFVLWRASPQAVTVEAIGTRGTRLRNSSGALPRIASPPVPRFAPHRALPGYAVNTGSRNSDGSRDLRDVTRNNTQHCVLPHVRLQCL